MGILGIEPEVSAHLLGQTIAGKFLVEALIGSGSMGRVYRARHLQLEQTVALKVMSTQFAGEKTLVARFEREAKASFAVAHPNIIRVIDYGREESSGLVYLAMEFVEGGDLAGLIFRAAPLPTSRIVHIMRQALAGIAAAHDAGVVHRDLKPENLMLAKVIDDDGRQTDTVKVCDFGIARLNDAHPSSERLDRGKRRLTEIGLIIGTPEYMPPEQARGEKVDARSDIYAMGVVLYEMLTGVLPFVANTPTETIIKQISDEPVPPSEGRQGVDPRLEEICLKALRKRPEDRYQSARQMRGTLGAVIGIRESSDSLPPLDPSPAPRRTKSKSEASAVRKAEANVPTMQTRAALAKAPEEPPAPSEHRVWYAAGAILLVAFGAAAFATFGHSKAPLETSSVPTPTAAPTPTAPTPAAIANPAATSMTATGNALPADTTRPATPLPTDATPGRKPLAVAPPPPHPTGRGASPGLVVVPTPDPTPSASPPPPVLASAAPPAAPVATTPPAVVAATPPPAPVSPPPPPPTAAPAPPLDPSAARASITGFSNIQGALKRDVEGAISRSAPHFADCYRSDLSAAVVPGSGPGVVHIETDDSGTITSAHASVPLSASGAHCLERAVVGVKIPNVDTGQAQADIAISFTLR